MEPLYDIHSWRKQHREEALTGQAGKRRSQDALQTRWCGLRLEKRPEPAQVAAS